MATIQLHASVVANEGQTKNIVFEIDDGTELTNLKTVLTSGSPWFRVTSTGDLLPANSIAALTPADSLDLAAWKATWLT